MIISVFPIVHNIQKNAHVLTYLHHAAESYEKLTVFQLVKNSPRFILSHLDPVHTPRSHFLKIHPLIYAWVSQVTLSLSFPTKTLYTPLFSPIRATCPAHLILLDFIT